MRSQPGLLLQFISTKKGERVIDPSKVKEVTDPEFKIKPRQKKGLIVLVNIQKAIA